MNDWLMPTAMGVLRVHPKVGRRDTELRPTFGPTPGTRWPRVCDAAVRVASRTGRPSRGWAGRPRSSVGHVPARLMQPEQAAPHR